MGIRVPIMAVATARERHPERSLADHPNPLVMDPELLRALQTLDIAIDKVLGLATHVEDDTRLKALVGSYQN